MQRGAPVKTGKPRREVVYTAFQNRIFIFQIPPFRTFFCMARSRIVTPGVKLVWNRRSEICRSDGWTIFGHAACHACAIVKKMEAPEKNEQFLENFQFCQARAGLKKMARR